MDSAILILLTIGAIYYIYKRTFKDSGCGCGKDSCPSQKQD